MQRKAYVPGVAALLAALLAGCTGSSGGDGTTDDANPGVAGTASVAAQPGKYRTLPEACGVVGQSTLDTLLPGIQQIADADQRARAYEGDATLTYDTDRKVGCRWKVEATDATEYLSIDFERVVSYDNAVSDDTQAQQLFAQAVEKADLPAATSSATSDVEGSGTASATASPSATPSGSASPGGSASATPSDLQPRLLDDLGDEAFLDDVVGNSGSTARQRKVTVAFRTSNVIVTIEYEEQPTTVGVTPDSKEMQDNARKLASQLAGSLSG
ncbi:MULTISPECIES: hypothetical protein [Streptomyces]|uniref:Secreted serine-rich protein n=1 Tax=Streptomyces sviceus (strain ATCC 29083 / DSM 924 / JCM 4929 / NBRC 13980 / NCIMB 11184 / NRRL 5439 / UC 5370) TaxID=463191 RepID=B5I6W5_STRX2|nr:MULTISPECIES: hypothetical protein [Streptomyces]EDY60820.1 secreted serine-rich protein [Streptomyces sviceus ATCC 29083]MYT07569.1 DUF3558 domain-containing protein [Streptomyces sp. SID5470]